MSSNRRDNRGALSIASASGGDKVGNKISTTATDQYAAVRMTKTATKNSISGFTKPTASTIIVDINTTPFVGGNNDSVYQAGNNTIVVETDKDVYLNNIDQITKQQFISNNVEGISGYSGLNGQNGTSLSEIPYDVMFAIYELMPANTIIGALLIARPTVLNATSNSQSLAVVQTPPSTLETVITVQRYVPLTDEITDIGTLTFSIGNKLGAVSLTPTSFNIGDVLQLKTSGVVDPLMFGFLSTIVTFYQL